MKVIFHVDELKKWDLTLTNVKNFLTEVSDANIEVLANSEAVKYYISDQADQLEAIGAKFLACRNALNSNQIAEENLASFIEVVPAGVVELAKKQAMGYAYIRP
ncbi:MAG: DsrE family protein [Tissierellia bacterium]|nr:DsrE family protein [Tissierellia bacterium]